MGASSSYEKLEHLGQGSFGAVYKVKRRESQQVFAMKEVKRTDPTAENEIEILKMVSHACIITYHESYVSPGSVHIVMEFADKGMLTSFIRNCDPMSAQWKDVYGVEWSVWRFLAHISCGLDYLHTFVPERILHRDLKPDNILGVTEYSTTEQKTATFWKLGDFGIAKLLDEESQLEYYTENIRGTPIYMAPEVLKGAAYTFSGDMWALGTVMSFWCNVGRHLFTDPGKVLEWPGGSSSLPKDYSTDLRRLIATLLHPVAGRRPTAADVYNECSSERMEAGHH